MALNYSHRQLFPVHLSDDTMASPFGILNSYLLEGVSDKNGEGCSRRCCGNLEEAKERNFNLLSVDSCFLPESASVDIIDLLPSDPFGMDSKTTFTAITGWLEDLEVGYGGYTRSNNGSFRQDGCSFIANWNLIWNNTLRCQSLPNNVQSNERPNSSMQYCSVSLPVDSFPGNQTFDDKFYTPNTLMARGQEKDRVAALGDCYTQHCQVLGTEEEDRKVEHTSYTDESRHKVFNCILGHLGVKDLLSMERVCKSLFSILRNEPFWWATIQIDQPLSERITNNILLKLVSKAQGQLQCLSLVECPKITDDGLRQILETNPQLIKLSVPGCTRISIECVVESLRVFNSKNSNGGIKNLRIGGLYGVEHAHYEELKSLLGVDSKNSGSYSKQHFYHRGNFYLPCEDDRALDIEMCPRCGKYRLVYDCPSEGCKIKYEHPQVCRGCTLCIARCAQCGRCINDTEFEETFCLELMCSDCFKLLL